MLGTLYQVEGERESNPERARERESISTRDREGGERGASDKRASERAIKHSVSCRTAKATP